MYETHSSRTGKFITSLDDPRIPPGIRIRTLSSGAVSYKRWLFPIGWGHLTLRQAYEYLTIVGAPQGKIPEVIRWTEGKDSHLVKQFFYGGVDLRAHDYIHILLGRGLLPKDEAFVIGFTMGTTNRLDSMNEDAFAYIAKHYYPNAYQMDDTSKRVFLDATKLGFISDCPPLDQVDFEPLLDLSVETVRERLNIHPDLLRAYYTEVEQSRYPDDPASKRLVHPADFSQHAWQMDSEDTHRRMSEAVSEVDKALDDSDQACELDADTFNQHLEQSYNSIIAHLGQQRELARQCFIEIDKVLDHENTLAKQDVEQSRWDDFYQTALENVNKSRKLVSREVHHASWEGYQTERSELRTWVHTLLGRADSPRDRAFCRGFFHGTSNRRTTYASQLKLDLMSALHISSDGLYSGDMIESYHDGARLGYISECRSLAEVDFESLHDLTVFEARKKIGLKTKLLHTYTTEIEKVRLLL